MDEKVEFVSGHSGSTLSENVLLLSMLPLSYLTWHMIGDVLVTAVPKPYICILLESFVLCFTLLFTWTIWQTQVLVVILVLIVVNCLIFLHKCRQSRSTVNIQRVKNVCVNIGDKLYTHERRFIASFKSFILITSAVCILAVDFTIYPRRFAKAEDFGVGLMDGGVGAFIVGSGVVSSYARCYHDHYDNIKVFRKNFISSLPIIVLGLLRVVFVMFSGYHVHVTEYGVHWNFFLTLAAVKILSSLIFVTTPYRLAAHFGIITIIVYQVTLSQTSLQSYVLDNSDRETLFAANKEGIISTVGYLALYLTSVGIGQYLFKARDRYRDWLGVLAVLLLFAAASLISLPLLQLVTDIPSRRLANLTYCVTAIGLSCGLLAAFLAVELLMALVSELGWSRSVTSDRKTHVPVTDPPLLIIIIKQNGLFYFILTNLLTGLVNLSINTLTVNPPSALLILASYLLLANYITFILNNLNLKTKFW